MAASSSRRRRRHRARTAAFELTLLLDRHRPALQTQRVHGSVGELGRVAGFGRNEIALCRNVKPNRLGHIRPEPARQPRAPAVSWCASMSSAMRRMRRTRPPRDRSHGRCRAAALRRRMRRGIQSASAAACNWCWIIVTSSPRYAIPPAEMKARSIVRHASSVCQTRSSTRRSSTATVEARPSRSA